MKKQITFKTSSITFMAFIMLICSLSFSQKAIGQTLWGAGSSNASTDSVGRFINEFGTKGAWKQVAVTTAALWTRTITGVSKGAYWGTNSQAFKSPGLADGAALFDSDFLDNGGTVGGSGSSPAPHHGELHSPVIDLTGLPTDNPIDVKLFLYYRLYDVPDFSVGFSADGGATWKDYNLGVLGKATGTVYGQDYVTVRLIGATKGISDLSNCKLRFVFNGDSYYAMIDNVSIQKGAPYDISFPAAGIYGSKSTMNPSPYFQFPKRFAEKANDQDYYYAAVILNGGGLDIPASANAKLTWELLKSSGGGSWNSVLKKDVAISKKILANDTVVVTGDITSDLNAAFVANGLGDYRFRYLLNSDLSDENPGNNEAHYDFTITDDYNTWFSATPLNANGFPLSSTGYFPSASPGNVIQTLEQGLYYYFPDQKDLAMQSVRYIANMPISYEGTTQDIQVRVYDVTDLAAQKDWPIVALAVDTINKTAGNIGKYLEREVLLTDINTSVKGYKLNNKSGIYCIAIAQNNEDGLIDLQSKKHFVYPSVYNNNNGLGGDLNYFYRCFLKITEGVPGTTGATKYYSGYSGSSFIPSVAVKMFDAKTIGIADILKESTSLEVYPNPVTDNLNLEINTDQAGSQASFILTDISGRIFSIENSVLVNNMTYTLNMKTLPSGNYIIHVKTDKGNVSKKIVKL
jgi:hypothetical protein